MLDRIREPTIEMSICTFFRLTETYADLYQFIASCPPLFIGGQLIGLHVF